MTRHLDNVLHALWISNVEAVALRDVGEQDQLLLRVHICVEPTACLGVAVQVMRLIDHHELIGGRALAERKGSHLDPIAAARQPAHARRVLEWVCLTLLVLLMSVHITSTHALSQHLLLWRWRVDRAWLRITASDALGVTPWDEA